MVVAAAVEAGAGGSRQRHNLRREFDHFSAYDYQSASTPPPGGTTLPAAGHNYLQYDSSGGSSVGTDPLLRKVTSSSDAGGGVSYFDDGDMTSESDNDDLHRGNRIGSFAKGTY